MERLIKKILRGVGGLVRSIYYRIRNLFPRKFLRHVDWLFLRGNVKIYGGKTLEVAVNEVLNTHPHSIDDNRTRREFEKEITRCFLNYGITPRDFFLFGFDSVNTSEEARASFVTDWDKDETLIKMDGWHKYLELSDKYAFYQKAKQFYGREMFVFDGKTDKESFTRFTTSVKDLFIKPNGGSYGFGAFIAECLDNDSADRLFKELQEKGGSWILEERIVQDEEMAKWNSSSVNTIRFTSILTDKGFHSLTPVLRTGRKGKIVDNGGSGGILADIDLETGTIYTDGIDEAGRTYSSHPDSNIPFKGTTIPNWNELLKTVELAHTTVAANHKYIGWDFALSNGKWIVIEGNWGQFLNQYCDKVGRKEEFLENMKGSSIKV